MTKADLINSITESKVGIVYAYNKYWRWWGKNDSHETSSFLNFFNFLFNIEFRSGTLVFIPDNENKAIMQDRNVEPADSKIETLFLED